VILIVVVQFLLRHNVFSTEAGSAANDTSEELQL